MSDNRFPIGSLSALLTNIQKEQRPRLRVDPRLKSDALEAMTIIL
ncbi:hypothetical protein SAMN05192569_10367 [Parageobacillus thermantarcticus]|uniref:Uncharacterized protein n=1 Tax=Parageobacillus thermantarcticus TaxID=186116 RepID=A0A1I0TN97_9BACL|nr:hypothetical protein SAMN05192569_10367 [Parageobacillus thermantarcticus]